ncbi:hypothetical protein THMIRHAS_21370 [Thiosulfatimonas sediminis]|uniref:Uncharacterized protein n=1 Tax=Thiosulfatimonas sediminis TaxID=2675054 RepID=A0A6F8PXP0_9GAMM|nr:hypothetical protein THMIRHAS_21370 [Thiosulfatimonas sediminis]
MLVTAVAGAVLWSWMILNQGLSLLYSYQTDPGYLLQIVAFGISSFLFLMVLWLFFVVGIRLIRAKNL